MSKLTKAQAKAHEESCKILKKAVLSEDDKFFVIENWQESATHINSAAGAFFTPWDLARDFSIETFQGRIIDLCAGIGILSFATKYRHICSDRTCEFVCVEINEEYAAVGRKLMPEATWIVASVFDILDMGLGHFDLAISNPPFGKIKRPEGKNAPRYTGGEFEFHVIDIASRIADYGVFILPQMSAGFTYSGRQHYERQTSGKAFDFQEKFGLRFEAGCGVDTALHKDSWRGVSPICEIVCCEFEHAPAVEIPKVCQPKVDLPAAPPIVPRSAPTQLSLFAEAAE